MLMPLIVWKMTQQKIKLQKNNTNELNLNYLKTILDNYNNVRMQQNKKEFVKKIIIN